MTKRLISDVNCRDCVMFYQRSNVRCFFPVCNLKSEPVYKNIVESKQLKLQQLLKRMRDI